MIKINLESTVSDKGLTTIPKKIRKRLNIKKGDKLYWIFKEHERTELIVIKKPLKFLKGRYSQKDLTYEKLEHKADELIKKKVENKSH